MIEAVLVVCTLSIIVVLGVIHESVIHMLAKIVVLLEEK